mgnify:CR=1 FL=1
MRRRNKFVQAESSTRILYNCAEIFANGNSIRSLHKTQRGTRNIGSLECRRRIRVHRGLWAPVTAAAWEPEPASRWVSSMAPLLVGSVMESGLMLVTASDSVWADR